MRIKADSRDTALPGETLVKFFTREEHANIPHSVHEAEWSAGTNCHLMLHHAGLLCIGLGDRSHVTAQTLRSAAGTAVRLLQKAGRENAALDLRGYARFAEAATEGAVLAAYNFEEFKTGRVPEIRNLRLVFSAGDLTEARKSVRRGEISGISSDLARDVANLPGNILYPETLAAKCRSVARKEGLQITVLTPRELEKGGFGGILAVGNGSARPPRLIILRHTGGKPGEAPIALVGKAITFDTGGISIKPAERMDEMVFDKCGGMAVLGAMAGIARLKLRHNVVGILAAAENMPSSTAYRPGDIVRTYDGTFVEVLNTDAEGRMVLADAIAYARKDCKARGIVDLATLTGACVVALGEYAAGLWSTSDPLKNALLAASERTGERLWPMPLYDEYTDQIRSDVAGFKNTGGRQGGACTAAAFLRHFACEIPWAHLDIAGVANRTKSKSDMARGATGFGARLLIALAESWDS